MQGASRKPVTSVSICLYMLKLVKMFADSIHHVA